MKPELIIEKYSYPLQVGLKFQLTQSLPQGSYSPVVFKFKESSMSLQGVLLKRMKDFSCILFHPNPMALPQRHQWVKYINTPKWVKNAIEKRSI